MFISAIAGMLLVPNGLLCVSLVALFSRTTIGFKFPFFNAKLTIKKRVDAMVSESSTAWKFLFKGLCNLSIEQHLERSTAERNMTNVLKCKSHVDYFQDDKNKKKIKLNNFFDIFALASDLICWLQRYVANNTISIDHDRTPHRLSFQNNSKPMLHNTKRLWQTIVILHSMKKKPEYLLLQKRNV